jgi:bidirectional [NiFe] hydrogenase diaphorase subunit
MQVTIDGIETRAEPGETVLEVARRLDIDIPTLCYHEGLESWGGCRLCTVEIHQRGWDEDWTNLVAACLFPAKDGLTVWTSSEKVKRVRRNVLDVLMADAPGAEVVKSLAREYGLEATTLKEKEPKGRWDDDCILCGMCVRVCEKIGCSALAMVGRGTEKMIAPPFFEAPKSCIGCLACALNCPTQCIVFEEADGRRRIWGKEFDLIHCEVSGEPIATPEMIEHFAKQSGLSKDDFVKKSPKVREREAAANAVGVKL